MPGVRDWLKKASSDLKASKKLSDDNETLDCSLFHTHQCAEKAFKAYIILTQQVIPKIHDLRPLLECCAKIDSELMLLLDESMVLDAYGYSSRYPNDNFHVNQQKVEDAIKMAEKILIIIKDKISLK